MFLIKSTFLVFFNFTSSVSVALFNYNCAILTTGPFSLITFSYVTANYLYYGLKAFKCTIYGIQVLCKGPFNINCAFYFKKLIKLQK